jgi:hypothetical protein
MERLPFTKMGQAKALPLAGIPGKDYCIAIGGGFGSVGSNWTGAISTSANAPSPTL